MREIICIHAGQAGVQLSSTVWELLCAEHGIQANGELTANAIEDDNLGFRSFFQEVPTGQFVPRVISIDLEPSVLDEIRAGPYRKLFHPDQLISGFEDAANNFARGHFTLGKDHIDYTMNKIGKIVNMCEALQGFLIFNSYGGGTGSGFGSLLLERLNVEFSKKLAFQVAVFPTEKISTATVEPYNTVLSTSFGIDKAGLCNFFDNEATYNICCNNLDIPRPTYSNLNRIIAQICSSVTVSVRFQGTLNADLDQIITNLVPYPRIHFPILIHAPMLSHQKAMHQQMTVGELTRSAFEPANQLVNVDLSEGKYMSCCLQYRGNINPKDINDALFDVKRRSDVQFVEWCPTGFKLGLNSQPPMFIPRSEIAQSTRSLTLLTNSSAISQKFLNLTDKFDLLFHKKSFIHWYIGEGMEEMEFFNAREEMSLITADYFELCTVEEQGPPPTENSVDNVPEENKAQNEDGNEINKKLSSNLGFHSEQLNQVQYDPSGNFANPEKEDSNSKSETEKASVIKSNSDE